MNGVVTTCARYAAVRSLVRDLKRGDRSAVESVVTRMRQVLGAMNGVFVPVPRHDAALPWVMRDVCALLGRTSTCVLRAGQVPSSHEARRQQRPVPDLAQHVAPMVVRGVVVGPIVIVDDVVTSGTTMNAVEQTIRAAGYRGPISRVAFANATRT